MERVLFLPELLTDPDDVPPAPKSPVSRAGQLCSLGEHRLLVGSAADLDGVRALCGDVQPECVWTGRRMALIMRGR